MKKGIRFTALMLLSALVIGYLSACGTPPTVQEGIVMTQSAAAVYDEAALTAAYDAVYGLLYRMVAVRTRVSERMKERLSDIAEELLALFRDVGVPEAAFSAYFAGIAAETGELVDEWTEFRRKSGSEAVETVRWETLYRQTLSTYGTAPCAAIVSACLRLVLEQEMDITRANIADRLHDQYLYPYYVKRLEEQKAQYEALCTLDTVQFTNLFRTVVMLLNVLTQSASQGLDELRASYTADEALLLFREMDFTVLFTGAQWHALFSALANVPGVIGKYADAAINCGDDAIIGPWMNELFCLLCAMQNAADTTMLADVMAGDGTLLIEACVACIAACPPDTVAAVTGLALTRAAYEALLAQSEQGLKILSAAPVTYEAFCALPSEERIDALPGLIGGFFYD